MKKPLKNNKGFTLIELMVALSVLLLVLAVTYQFFYRSMHIYNNTEERWLAESDVKNVANQINNAIELSYAATLYTSPPSGLAEGERQFAYNSATQTVTFTDYNPKTQQHLPAVTLNEFPVSINFTNVKTETDGTTTTKSDMVYITVSSLRQDYSYTLQTAVYLPNVIKSVNTNGTGPYNCLIFSIAKDGVVDVSSAVPDGHCFVATAAYGDYDADNVMLLRIFRDNVLQKFSLGRDFIDFYYKNSPPLANIIAKNPSLRFASRVLLQPLIGVAVLVLHPVFSVFVIALCIFGFKIYKKGKKQLKA